MYKSQSKQKYLNIPYRTRDFQYTKTGNHIRGQILRSGSSPAPNYGETQSAEFKPDFINKLKIALKELKKLMFG